jgi:hypothetical protein
VRIREDVPDFARDVWLVVHHDLRRVPPVRAVMEFVSQAVAEEPTLKARDDIAVD